MLTREDVLQYIKKTYDTEPHYLWKKFPDYAVFKHTSDEKKWYGIVMNVLPEKLGLEGEEEMDVLELKSPPELNGSLKERNDITEAYHLNKEHWISIILSQVNEITDIEQLIKTSFDLTKD